MNSQVQYQNFMSNFVKLLHILQLDYSDIKKVVS